MTELIAKKAEAYQNTEAAANKTIPVVGEVMLLVPAATEAARHEEESLATPASPVPILTESNTTAVGSMGCAVVKAVADVVGAVVNTTVRNVDHHFCPGDRQGNAYSEDCTTTRRDNECTALLNSRGTKCSSCYH